MNNKTNLFIYDENENLLFECSAKGVEIERSIYEEDIRKGKRNTLQYRQCVKDELIIRLK